MGADRIPAAFAEQLAVALKQNEEGHRALLEIRTACMTVLGFDQIEDD